MTTITDRYLTRIPVKRDWVLTLVIAGLSVLLSAYVAYSNNDKAITSRVVVIETQQKNDEQRLERIENKVDRILERVK